MILTVCRSETAEKTYLGTEARTYLPSVGHVAMDGLDPVAFFRQALVDFLCDHHGAVLAPRATEGHCQIALALLDVMRQQEEQQLRHPVQKLTSLGKVSDVFGHFGMAPGQVTELGNEMRIGQEPGVENQVGFERDTVLVTETDRGDQKVLVRISTLKLLQDVGTQFMHVVSGGVDSDIGQISDGI